MQPLAISQECLYFHKKFGCIYALTSYFCPVCIVRCISSCHILFHFFKEKSLGSICVFSCYFCVSRIRHEARSNTSFVGRS